jgi:hypothetical protein
MRKRDISKKRRKAGLASSRARRSRGQLREQMSSAVQIRMSRMTPEERSAMGRHAARARWAKVYEERERRTGELPPDDDLVL